jgi:hypothetical protein
MYASGTVSGQANTGAYFYTNVIAPFLTSAGGPWSFVETTVVSTTTYSVWKSAGASNNSHMDWYVVFGYQTAAQSPGSTVFTVDACEVYSSASHTWNRCVLGCSFNGGFSGAFTSPFDAANGNAYTAASPNTVGTRYQNLIGAAGSVGQYFANLAPTSGATFPYVIIANADGLYFGFNGGVGGGLSGFFYVGAFNSYVPSDQPLCMIAAPFQCAPSFATGSLGGVSRDPQAGGAANCYPYVCGWPASNGASWGVGHICSTTARNMLSAPQSSWAYVDAYTGTWWASQILLNKLFVSTGAYTAIAGVFRGQSPDWLMLVQNYALSFGDTVTVGGVTYTCVPSIATSFQFYMIVSQSA